MPVCDRAKSRAVNAWASNTDGIPVFSIVRLEAIGMSNSIIIRSLKTRIKNARAGGQSDSQIRAGLVAEFWGRDEIQEAFRQLDGEILVTGAKEFG